MNRFLSLCLALILLGGCQPEPKTLAELYEGDLSDVTRIAVHDGSTGSYKQIEGQEAEDFLQKLKAVTFIPDDNQEARTGWRYGFRFYEGKKETMNFTLNELDGIYYTTEPDLHPAVDEYYKSLETPAKSPIYSN